MKFIITIFFFHIYLTVISSSPRPASVRAQQNTNNDPDKNKLLAADYIKILDLFKHIHKPSVNKFHLEIAQEFNPEDHLNEYYDEASVKQFFHFFNKDILQPNEIFSIYHPIHSRQAGSLYYLFYNARNFTTFYKTAVWARQKINHALFLHALSAALLHRADTKHITLPPIHEINPNYFFRAEIIKEAKEAGLVSNKPTRTSGESSLRYFTEDIGINAFYYYQYLLNPFWLSGSDSKRGELFFFLHQQLLARYYLERLANNLGEIPDFEYNAPFKTGFSSSLEYFNGVQFPVRADSVNLHEYFYNYGQIWMIRNNYGHTNNKIYTYEKRIVKTISDGFVLTKSGSANRSAAENDKGIVIKRMLDLNDLANIIEGNKDSINLQFYGSYLTAARHILGSAPQPKNYHHLVSSVLEHPETSMRDPAFYQLLKKVMQFFQKYKCGLEPYKREELEFPGVRIGNAETNRLETYFEDFYSEIDDGVRILQNRLGHGNVSYKIRVTSDRNIKASVRLYLGPKYDEFGNEVTLHESYVNLVQLDQFIQDLIVGDNEINRDINNDNCLYSKDQASFNQLYENVAKGFINNNYSTNYGFPHRLLLPKGAIEGREFQFIIVISPFLKKEEKERQFGIHELDGYPLGYPFDRPLHYNHNFFNFSNIYHFTAKIYHKI